MPLTAVGAVGTPVNAGLTANTFAPEPVLDWKSVKPKSQLAAVVPDVKIQITCSVVPGITVLIKLPPDEFTVKVPEELFTISYVQPKVNVLATGNTIV